MLTLNQLLEIATRETVITDKPERFWVDSDGKKHIISGSVSATAVGSFQKMPGNRNRKYIPGEAIYYRV